MPSRRLLPALVFLVAASGCATRHHTPKAFELRDEIWPSLRSTAPVEVRAGDAPVGEFTIELAGLTMTLDLSEYTRSLADQVSSALDEQGIELGPNAPKTLEVEVVHANILPGAGNSHCVVDFTVRAGNGYVHGHQTRDKSLDAQKACNAALSRAALQCLLDPQVQAYLAAADGRGARAGAP